MGVEDRPECGADYDGDCLEVGFSARSAEELRVGAGRPPLAAMPIEYLTPSIEDRAIAVQAALTERGQHRPPSVPDC